MEPKPDKPDFEDSIRSPNLYASETNLTLHITWFRTCEKDTKKTETPISQIVQDMTINHP